MVRANEYTDEWESQHVENTYQKWLTDSQIHPLEGTLQIEDWFEFARGASITPEEMERAWTGVDYGTFKESKANERDIAMTNRQMNDQAYDIMAEEEWGKSVAQLTNIEYKWIEDLMQDYGDELTSADKPKAGESKATESGKFLLSWDEPVIGPDEIKYEIFGKPEDGGEYSTSQKMTAFNTLTQYHALMISNYGGSLVANLFDQNETCSFVASFDHADGPWSNGGAKNYLESLSIKKISNSNISGGESKAKEFKPELQGKKVNIVSGPHEGKSGTVAGVEIFGDSIYVNIDGQDVNIEDGDYVLANEGWKPRIQRCNESIDKELASESWTVKLNDESGQYSPTREQTFDNEEDAKHYRYLLANSNFDNPYNVPVIMSKSSESKKIKVNESKSVEEFFDIDEYEAKCKICGEIFYGSDDSPSEQPNLEDHLESRHGMDYDHDIGGYEAYDDTENRLKDHGQHEHDYDMTGNCKTCGWSQDIIESGDDTYWREHPDEYKSKSGESKKVKANEAFAREDCYKEEWIELSNEEKDKLEASGVLADDWTVGTDEERKKFEEDAKLHGEAGLYGYGSATGRMPPAESWKQHYLGGDVFSGSRSVDPSTMSLFREFEGLSWSELPADIQELWKSVAEYIPSGEAKSLEEEFGDLLLEEEIGINADTGALMKEVPEYKTEAKENWRKVAGDLIKEQQKKGKKRASERGTDYTRTFDMYNRGDVSNQQKRDLIEQAMIDQGQVPTYDSALDDDMAKHRKESGRWDDLDEQMNAEYQWEDKIDAYDTPLYKMDNDISQHIQGRLGSIGEAYVTREIWNGIDDIIFRLTLLERAGFDEDVRVGWYTGAETWEELNADNASLISALSSTSITEQEIKDTSSTGYYPELFGEAIASEGGRWYAQSISDSSTHFVPDNNTEEGIKQWINTNAKSGEKWTWGLLDERTNNSKYNDKGSVTKESRANENEVLKYYDKVENYLGEGSHALKCKNCGEHMDFEMPEHMLMEHIMFDHGINEAMKFDADGNRIRSDKGNVKLDQDDTALSINEAKVKELNKDGYFFSVIESLGMDGTAFDGRYDVWISKDNMAMGSADARFVDQSTLERLEAEFSESPQGLIDIINSGVY